MEPRSYNKSFIPAHSESGRLAQLGERQLDMLEVGGSKPSPPTTGRKLMGKYPAKPGDGAGGNSSPFFGSNSFIAIMVKRPFVALAVAMSIAGCGDSAAPPSHALPSPISAPPRSLAVGVADLPKRPTGWTVDAAATRTISDAKELLGDSSDVTPYRTNGWSSAYEADFVSAGTDAEQVRVLIHQFQSQVGARAFFAQGIGSQKGQHGQPLANPPKLGQDSNVFVQHISGKNQTQFWFYWVDRNVIVRLLVAGPDVAISEAEATATAERQASLIASL